MYLHLKLYCYWHNEDLWKNFGINIFKILVKIFQDLSFSYLDLQGSFIFLLRFQGPFIFFPRSLTILKELNRNFENPWRSWQESKRSLKILARIPKILARKLEILTQFIRDVLESHPLINPSPFKTKVSCWRWGAYIHWSIYPPFKHSCPGCRSCINWIHRWQVHCLGIELFLYKV